MLKGERGVDLRIHKSFLIFLLIFTFFLGSGYRGLAKAMTVAEEKKLGEKILLEMERSVERIRDLILDHYIQQIGENLVSHAGPIPFEFKFYLIKHSEPNAYAIPGGHIFLTTGLLVLADNEQELAGVISHEIAHVMARHVVQMIERSKRINIATMAAIVAGLLVGGGGKASEAMAATAMATAEALALKYTREMEVEADQNSLRYMIKAGYDPHGLITFMNKIYRLSLTSFPKIPLYLSTHPAIEDRISLMGNLLQSIPRSEGPFRVVGGYEKIRARALVEDREPHTAVIHFQSLVDEDPKRVEAYYGLGLAYRKMGRLDKSIEIFQVGLACAPQDTDLLRELGIAYFLAGKPEQARKHLEDILSIFQGQEADSLTLFYLGRVNQMNGDFTRALTLFQKVQKKNPEFLDVYHSLGSIYGRLGQKGLSHFFFGKYFRLKGDKKNALLHLRTALEELDRGSMEMEETQKEIKELTSLP